METQKQRFVTVGGKRFHYIWLRDNCLCPQCRHPTSFQKLYDMSDRTSPPEPLSVEEQDGELRITWNEDPAHLSKFPVSWLLSHAYDNRDDYIKVEQEIEDSRKEILWDKTWIEEHLSLLSEVLTFDSNLWLERIYTLGFAVLRNIDFNDLESTLSSIGPIYKSDHGLFSTIKAQAKSNDLGLTGHALSLHTDYPYWHTPNLLSCLYCAKNEALGGESVMVDGFRVATDFRQEHPHLFNILSQTPIQFQQFYTQWQYYYCRTQPILELDKFGKLARINFAHSHSYNWKLPFDQMEQFYAAYTTFFQYLKNPVYQYCFRLKPRELLLMNNARILHGRQAFEGNRHMEVACISWDFLNARERFHQNKHLYIG